jgi:hypothetical protein
LVDELSFEFVGMRNRPKLFNVEDSEDLQNTQQGNNELKKHEFRASFTLTL